MPHRFGRYVLDAAGHELSGPDGLVHLEPQAFDVLVHLVENSSRVVSKNELLDSVWGSRFVSESALTTRIKSIRSALGDSGKAQHTIRTIHGKGYRFVAEIELPQDGQPEDDQPVDGLDSGATVGPPPGSDAGSVEPDQDDAVLRRVPPPPDQLRGRLGELDQLQQLIDAESVVTLLGPGGTGKTRLSIELAARLPVDQSVVFVDLAAVRNGEAVGQALASSLRVEIGAYSDIVDACMGYLRAAPMLLVIDNCEHVVDAAARLIDRISSESPDTAILATSRVPLSVQDETVFPLAPLPVPAGAAVSSAAEALGSPAVALFVDRARKVRYDYQLDDTAVPDVLALCAALDGLPLALELAAGRMGSFGLNDLVERLDRRLDLLGDGRTGTDDRHRSLRATLDWSYELLDAEAKKLFLHLSVFPAGHALDGIEWLGGRLGLPDPLVTVQRLVEASLLGRADTPSGVRYTQLETMRTHGVTLLNEENLQDQALDLAAAWALKLTVDMAATLRSPREVQWNDRIRRELPNIRQARVHLSERGRHDELIGLSVNLHDWGRLRDVSELWNWTDDLKELDGLTGEQAAIVQTLAALGAWRRGWIQEAIELCEAALAADPDDWTRARALDSLATARLFSGDPAGAAESWRARSDLDGDLGARANAELCDAYVGQVDEAEAVVVKLLHQATRAEWPEETAWCQYILGEIQATGGRPTAIDHLTRAVDGAQEVGSAFIVGVAGVTLCSLTAADGDVVDAAGRYRELIAHWLRSGGWTQQWTTLRNAAALLADTDPGLALTLLSAADVDADASELVAETRQDCDRLKAELADALDDHRRAEAELAAVDRAELAERARASLAELMHG